jgi:DNA-binding PucR family transcriptional regulator
VRELIRRGAEVAVGVAEALLDEMDQAATSSHGMEAIVKDPVLAAAIRRTTRANFAHWAASNVRDPGAPVEPVFGAEHVEVIRELARRGLQTTVLDAYRIAQNIALRRWTTLAIDLTSDRDELRELLDISAHSITEFITATMGVARAAMQLEDQARGTHPERRETVELIVEGAPIAARQASQRLGYELDQRHRAAVVWTDDPQPDARALDEVATAFGATDGVRPLTIIASTATLWVWRPARTEVDPKRLALAVRQAGTVRIAIGSSGHGIDGFRRSHIDALRTQRMVARLGSVQQVVRFDEVRAVLLVTQDLESADEFVTQTLGALETADPEIRTSVLTFLHKGCNVSAAAECLHTHRNTLLRRLARADELLPRPLETNRVDVAVALEIQRWRGARTP